MTLGILEPLFNCDNEYVLLNVASSMINLLPDKSINVLEELCEKRGMFSVEARMFLNEWRKGNIKY